MNKITITLVIMLSCLAGCSHEYRPQLQSELLLLADPVVRKWHADGFTIEHAYSETYHAEAGLYVMPDIQPMRDLIHDNGNRTVDHCLAEIECIRTHYSGTEYEKEALALCDLLDPRPHIGPVTEPTSHWRIRRNSADPQ